MDVFVQYSDDEQPEIPINGCGEAKRCLGDQTSRMSLEGNNIYIFGTEKGKPAQFSHNPLFPSNTSTSLPPATPSPSKTTLPPRPLPIPHRRSLMSPLHTPSLADLSLTTRPPKPARKLLVLHQRPRVSKDVWVKVVPHFVLGVDFAFPFEATNRSEAVRWNRLVGWVLRATHLDGGRMLPRNCACLSIPHRSSGTAELLSFCLMDCPFGSRSGWKERVGLEVMEIHGVMTAAAESWVSMNQASSVLSAGEASWEELLSLREVR